MYSVGKKLFLGLWKRIKESKATGSATTTILPPAHQHDTGLEWMVYIEQRLGNNRKGLNNISWQFVLARAAFCITLQFVALVSDLQSSSSL